MHFKPVLYVLFSLSSCFLGLFTILCKMSSEMQPGAGGRGSVHGHCVNGLELAAISEYQVSVRITNSYAC